MIYRILCAVIINNYLSSGLCPILRNPAYGYVEQTEEYATYYCEQNYELLGGSHRECKYGEWSGKVPVCWDGHTLECIDLIDPRYGFVHYSNGLKNGSMAQYICQDEYSLFGTRKRQCLNGHWEGLEPFCLKTTISCSKIDLLYGAIDFSNDFRTAGTTAIHRCRNDTRLLGANVRTCGRDGLWSGVSPICEPILPKSSTLAYNLEYCVIFSVIWTTWEIC